MFFISLLSHLPLRVLYVIGDLLAFLAQHVIRYRYRVVCHNVDLCFPDLDPKARKAIVHDFYRHFAEIIVEAVWTGGSNFERFHKQHLVELVNPGSLDGLTDDGRSLVILSSHFANWELTGGLFASNYSGKPLAVREEDYVVVYKKQKSEKWDKFLFHNRIAPLAHPEVFNGCQETNEILRFVVQHRQDQKFYNFITDQRPYKAAKGTLPVTFMGQQCQTMAAAANLAQRFGFAVVYLRMLNQGRGRYTYEFVPICADASATTSQEIMDRYYELLTEDVKAQPGQYLWSHKRFK